MENKRGQALSTSAIVLIILAVVVLVILILGFTMGWDQLAPWIKPNNVENINTACSVACATSSTYDFCDAPRTLKAEGLPGGVKKVTGTCYGFATGEDYASYRIDGCDSITCISEEAEGTEGEEEA